MEREPPKSLEEFVNLSWSQKRQLKESFPEQYWHFIGQIKNDARKEERL